MPKNTEAVEPYLRNIMLYEKIFGLLYLQPLYLCRLLVCDTFPDSEKIFKLIKDLYIKCSASKSKNVSYLMCILLTLLSTEKHKIVDLSLGPAAFDLYSLKIFMLICNTNPVIDTYFGKLKESILAKVIEISQYNKEMSAHQGSEQLNVGIYHAREAISRLCEAGLQIERYWVSVKGWRSSSVFCKMI